MPKFSQISNDRLKTCAPELQRLFAEVIKTYDCTIICGYRTAAEQAEHLKNGKTKVKQSKHNEQPAQAIDVSPYPIPENWGAINFKERARFYHFAGYVKGIAETLKIPIRWGGDWNGNNKFSDQTFDDLVHFELVTRPE